MKGTLDGHKTGENPHKNRCEVVPFVRLMWPRVVRGVLQESEDVVEGLVWFWEIHRVFAVSGNSLKPIIFV